MSEERRARARLALEGLSLGDAFGERFIANPIALLSRALPEGTWPHTDDTAMAQAIVEVLEEAGAIDPDRLAARFAARWQRDPARGYGRGAQRLLAELARGADWRQAAPALFGGEGSLGNGGAMRAAPLGGWFADDPQRAAAEAVRSAAVTHAHPEGQAGAVAVAVAAALAWQRRHEPTLDAAAYLQDVAALVPHGAVWEGLRRALDHGPDAPIDQVAGALGNGERVTAADTVPFCLWAVTAGWGDYPEALWRAASALGDIDTNCAIVGGVLALAVGEPGLPAEWLERREPLDLGA